MNKPQMFKFLSVGMLFTALMLGSFSASSAVYRSNVNLAGFKGKVYRADVYDAVNKRFGAVGRIKVSKRATKAFPYCHHAKFKIGRQLRKVRFNCSNTGVGLAALK